MTETLAAAAHGMTGDSGFEGTKENKLPNGDISGEKTGKRDAPVRPKAGIVSQGSSRSLIADAQMKGMKLIFQKEMPKISVDRYYQTFWSEEASSFFESWLVGDGKSNVEVGQWTSSPIENDEEGPLLNPYDDETYDQVRTISYSYDRTTSVYSGIVSVQMTQYCRRVRRSICVVASTIQFSGMPYSKAFRVYIRWVASRQKRVSLRIQVLLDVVFLEKVLVASQIKFNTMNEMTQAQLSLFRNMKNALGLDTNLNGTGIARNGQNPVQKGISLFFPFANVGNTSKNDALMKIEEARTKLARVRELPLKALANELEEQRHYIISEMDAVHEALDAILLRKYSNRDSAEWSSSTEASSPLLVKMLTQVRQSLQSFWDGTMRKITPRRIQVRDPSLFVKNDGVLDKPDLPKPDDALAKMEVIVSSSIADVSLEEFVNIFLTDEQGQNGFYADWLSKTDRKNIQIDTWDDGDKLQTPFVDGYSGETFRWRRTITASFDKAKFSQDKAPSVESTQTQEQFYRMDGNYRLVFASTTKLTNVPFADSFDVHTRWVVTELRSGELSVKVGLAVLFEKQNVLLEPKIRAGATREGRRTQINLLLKIRSALGKINETRSLTQQHALAESLTPTPRLAEFFSGHLKECAPRALGDLLEGDSTLHEEFENAKLKLRAIYLFLKERENAKDWEPIKFALGELNVVIDALDNIVDWHGDSGDGSKALVAASLL
ncbi:hypothetical protein ACA910_016650 [Epithemia clementina (nom. ined.)]